MLPRNRRAARATLSAAPCPASAANHAISNPKASSSPNQSSSTAKRSSAGTKASPTTPTPTFWASSASSTSTTILLWHEEDVARSPDVSDARIAMVKRAIDGYNQQRNDWIERLDEALLEALADAGASPTANARLNTETPGSAIDRLSIMALRIYHLEEQLERTDVDQTHVERVSQRLQRCRAAASRPVAVAGRAACRPRRRPQAAQGVPPDEDVQRPDAQSVPVPPRRQASGLSRSAA